MSQPRSREVCKTLEKFFNVSWWLIDDILIEVDFFGNSGSPWGRINSGDLSVEGVENAVVGAPKATTMDIIIPGDWGHHHHMSPSGFLLEFP